MYYNYNTVDCDTWKAGQAQAGQDAMDSRQQGGMLRNKKRRF